MDFSKRRLTKTAFSICILFPCLAYADCWQIENADRKYFCLARVQKDNSYCWQINNNSIKYYCLALLQKDKNYCWQIEDNDIKQECLTLSTIENCH